MADFEVKVLRDDRPLVERTSEHPAGTVKMQDGDSSQTNMRFVFEALRTDIARMLRLGLVQVDARR